MQISIINGIYADAGGDYRTQYPRNMVPVPKGQGVSQEYLLPAEGIEAWGAGGPGVDRGGILWGGVLHRVMGGKLCRVNATGVVTQVGSIPGSGQCTLDYSADRLVIAGGGKLHYWDGADLTTVTDTDLGIVLDAVSVGGYTMTTDGTFLVVTELSNPLAVDPLKYGSAEVDPDRIMAVDRLNTEAYALGRHTIEPFQNVGGDGFPFQRIQGAQIARGIIGTHAYARTDSTFIFLGSGRNEAPGVYRMVSGGTDKLSTAEIDRILAGYTEDQLSLTVAEWIVEKGHEFVRFHLPDQTLVYDLRGTQAAQQHLWHTLTSSVVGLGAYRGRNAVWAYGKWVVGDVSSGALGVLTSDSGHHFGQVVGWDFGTAIIYLAGNDGLIHELELVCLTGRVAPGTDPVVWTSYSTDGETWSQERPTRAGRSGQRAQRICWRTQGQIRGARIQRFRGTSEARLSIARLEAAIEALSTRPRSG